VPPVAVIFGLAILSGAVAGLSTVGAIVGAIRLTERVTHHATLARFAAGSALGVLSLTLSVIVVFAAATGRSCAPGT